MAKRYFKKQQRKKEVDPKTYSDGRRKPTGLNPYVTPMFRVPGYERPTKKEEIELTADVMASIIADAGAEVHKLSRDGQIDIHEFCEPVPDKNRFTKVES